MEEYQEDDFKVQNEHHGGGGYFRDSAAFIAFIFLIGPLLSFCCVEIMENNNPFTSLGVQEIILNLALYYLIYTVVWLAAGRMRLSLQISSAFCFAWGTANYYVLLFRGRALFPCDVISIKTAANVAGGFDYTPTKPFVAAAAVFAAYFLLLRLIPRERKRTFPGWKAFSACIIGAAAFSFVFFFTDFLPDNDIYVQQWKTTQNGFFLNFAAALKYSIVKEPDGYSTEIAEKIVENTKSGETESGKDKEAGSGDGESDADAAKDDGDTQAAESEAGEASSETGTASELAAEEAEEIESPENLIVIMNESFADMTMFSGLEFSEDPTPFFHKLKYMDNTISGYMYSPVTGGGTANVEFEYLTGESLAFLPAETVAYQLYMYDGAQSLVSAAAAMGYHTVSFHPYEASGWNRTSVYKWLGFDEQFYQEDVVDPAYIRDYISDSCDYKQLYRWTDTTDEPVFIFNVTMQNHSGYQQGWDNLSMKEALSTFSTTGSETQYFSLMRESDNAIQELIEHYSASDESTMIVFFGDHQPPLSTAFYETAYGKSLDSRTTEEIMEEYEVPFFIWSNYDIPEEQDVKISSNFLGVLTAQMAGFDMTGYGTFLTGVMNELPVITTSGIIAADGTVYDSADELDESQQELYTQYEYLAYNYLFDKKGRLEGFF